MVHHAIIICSENKINLEIEFIMKILVENAYSVDIAQAIIRAKIAQINKSVQSICTCRGLLILVLDLLAKWAALLFFCQSTCQFHICKLCWNPSAKMFCPTLQRSILCCIYIKRMNQKLEIRTGQYVPVKICWVQCENLHMLGNTLEIIWSLPYPFPGNFLTIISKVHSDYQNSWNHLY